MIKELMKKFEIKHIFSTSYHSKTNGLVERFNKTLCELLAKLKKDQNWDRKIILAAQIHSEIRYNGTLINQNWPYTGTFFQNQITYIKIILI
jgi:transposase InsO family protein